MEDLLHRVQIQTIPRDLRGFGVLLQDGLEPAGITGCHRDHTLLVSIRFLEQSGGSPASLGNDVIGIGAALVDETLAILCRFVGVLKRCLNLFGRLHLLNRHVHHAHPGFVAVKDVLHQFLGDLGNLLLLFVQDLIDLASSHRLAHGGLSALADDLLGLRARIVVEQPGLRITNPVLHCVLHIDNALIAGEDQRLFEDLVFDVAAITHLELTQLLDVHQFVGLDRRWKTPGETRPVVEFAELAKAHHHRGLPFLDDIETTAQPQQQHQCEQDTQTNAGIQV